MNSKISHSDYHCPICETFIPPIEIEILDRIRKVQPVCKCVSEQDKKFFVEKHEQKEKHEVKRLFSMGDLGKRFEESQFDNLLIWGDPGNGKTHVASAIAKTLDEQGYMVVFQSVPELLERIRSTFRNGSKDTEGQIMKALLHCDLLVLDDIGAEKLTDWVQDIIFRIVDGRYRKEKPILYTSNLPLKQLADQVSFRTYDRITETSVIVQNQATSYRREIAKNRYEQFKDR